MSLLREKMPLLLRHAGMWSGTYRHITPALDVVDQHEFRIEATFPEDGSCDYRQISHYMWPDGRTEDRVFEADFDPESCRLKWDNGRIAGELWELDATTIYLTFSFAGETPMRLCEMMQLSPCGQHRARTWHWFEADRLVKLTLVDEARLPV